MKKQNIIIICLAALLALGGIGAFYINYQNDQKEKAIATCKSYERYILMDQPERAKDLLSQLEDESIVPTLTNFDSADAQGLITKANHVLAENENFFSVNSVEKKNGMYIVKATVQFPNFPQIALSLPRYGLFTDWSSADSYIDEANKNGTLPVSENASTYYVIKENGEFKIEFSE